ncbi:hypothetical protein CHUAL_009603 [Chamberlinius hualienensis]
MLAELSVEQVGRCASPVRGAHCNMKGILMALLTLKAGTDVVQFIARLLILWQVHQTSKRITTKMGKFIQNEDKENNCANFCLFNFCMSITINMTQMGSIKSHHFWRAVFINYFNYNYCSKSGS